MEKISNFNIILLTLVILVVLVVTKTYITVNERHEEKAIYAMESKVEYYAKRCYLEGNCSGTISLQDLYDKGYLNEVVNPVTSEVINSNLKINYVDDEIKIDWN